MGGFVSEALHDGLIWSEYPKKLIYSQADNMESWSHNHGAYE